MDKYEIKNKNRFSIHTIKIIKDHKDDKFDAFLKQSSSRLQEYFKNIGIIIDLIEIRDDENFKNMTLNIVETLKNNNFIVSGFSNNKDSQKEWLNETFNVANFHELTNNNENHSLEPKVIEKIVEKIVEIEVESKPNILGLEKYEGIVRGGQRIYAKGNNLLIIGDVKANAEIIADGDIIVLGKLSGNAIAGANENPDAIITAHEFNASMISIAGNYRHFEENSEYYGKKVRLLIKNNKLVIEKY